MSCYDDKAPMTPSDAMMAMVNTGITNRSASKMNSETIDVPAVFF